MLIVIDVKSDISFVAPLARATERLTSLLHGLSDQPAVRIPCPDVLVGTYLSGAAG
jgi:hypothetical protein